MSVTLPRIDRPSRFPEHSTPPRASIPAPLLFRELNEEIALRAAYAPGDLIELRCECNLHNCADPIALALAEYEEIRRFPTRFMVRPGHAAPGSERIVERHERFDVVEAAGHTAQTAIVLDPRRDGARARAA